MKSVFRHKLSSSQIFWLTIFGLCNLIWLMNFGIIVTDELSSGYQVDLKRPLLLEFTGVYGVLALLPILLWLFRTHPLSVERLPRLLPLYLGVMLGFGLSHTTILILSRKFLFHLFGWGSYSPGILLYRYVMEFQKQFVIFWFIYGVFALIAYVRSNHEQRLKTIRLQEQLTRSRRKALKLQLEPHFLFNTLNMISATMYEDVDAADRMITKLSDLLRFTLYSGEAQATSLADDLQILDQYIAIMEARFGDRIQFEKEIEPSALPICFPVLTLQPVVENSIKYGLIQSSSSVDIKIQAKIENNQLVVEVSDNGPGLEAGKSFVNGSGLRIIRERLASQFGDNHTFEMKKQKRGGMCTRIRDPANIREVI